ncbi:MAG: LytTR family DNA-binding domain-containing protein, partial [Lachnospiraceae bacterium]|nr:LytTR family DNA-binding domain-containing protein [Lachnospiraceae bacterium]
DIYMGNENGVDTAEELRRFDPDCLLVFITTSTDHALDGFRVRALHYLVKPYEDAALAALFDEIVKRFPVTDRYLEINATGGIARLRFRDILYAEHYQHQIYIYSTDGEKHVTRQTFREFTAALTDGRFFLCSRGVLVNMEHAEDFDGMDFILKDGKRIPVSRHLSKTARMAFGDFLFGRRV